MVVGELGELGVYVDGGLLTTTTAVAQIGKSPNVANANSISE